MLYPCIAMHVPCSHPDRRPWRYNENVSEYYVVLDDKLMQKMADTTRETEETALADSWLFPFVKIMH